MSDPHPPSDERWLRVKAIFQDAIDRDPTARAPFLDEACAGDAGLRADVDSLLEQHHPSTDFLESPDLESFIGSAFQLEGRHVGPYRMLRKIGQGGMGAVYLAERTDEFRQQVAIKVVMPGFDLGEIVDRFRRERQTLANLDHPNIAKLLDGGAADDGRPYFVMEYVEGTPIDDYCEAHALSMADRLRLFRTVCSAVQDAHQNLVVHRDIKPDNILVTTAGVPKLVDFGIAKLIGPSAAQQTVDLTRGRGGLMTPEYASPEQVRADPITTATDVYSLGVLLFELLTGALPYRLERRTTDEIARAVCDQDPDPPSAAVMRAAKPPTGEESAGAWQRRLAGDVDAVLLKALRKEPALRYGSVEQFAEDIRRFQDGLPVLAQRDAFTYRAKKFVRRHKAGVASSVAIVGVLVGAVILTTWQARIAARERDRSNIAAATAEQINAFILEMLGSADPYVEGKDVTVAQTLAQAVRRIDTALAGQPEVAAAVRSTIANTYVNLGLVDEAEPLLRRALADRRRSLGADHPDIAANLSDLAYLTIEKRDLPGAEALYRDSRDMYQRLGLGESAGILPVLNGLGRLAVAKGDDTGADALYRHALVVARKIPDGDRHIAENLNDLAVLRQQHADLKEAEALYREALDIIGRLRGPESPEMATGLSNLSGVLESRKDFAAAEPLSARALEMRRKLLGNDHPDVAFTLLNHADLLSLMGRHDDAIRLTDEILARRGKSLPDAHPAVAGALLIRGRSLSAEGRAASGEPNLREALALRRAALPPGHWLIASTTSTLGGCLAAQGRYAEAEPLLVTSYERLNEDRGPRHDRTVDALKRIVDLYEAWKKPEQAERYRVKQGQ